MFDYSNFMPHGHCFLWTPWILWSWVIFNGLIALAYYSIPAALFYFVRKRRDLEYKWLFFLFGFFIIFCGTSHLISIYTLWVPNYVVQVAIDGATAFVSVVTAILLWPSIPKLLRLPSPATLAEKNRQLEELNRTLENKVNERVGDSKRLAAIVNQSKDAIFAKSLDGNILSWNFAAEKMFQYTADEIIGKSVFLLVPKDRISEEESILGKIKEGIDVGPFDSVRVRKDGTEVPVSISVSAIRDDGVIMAASSIVRDRTHNREVAAKLKKAVEELGTANRELANVNRAKDEFIANLAHELRSPLNIITGYTGLIGQYTAGSQEFNTALDGIKRAAKTQTHLVEDLLDMSRIISGKFSLTLGTHNIFDIVSNAFKAIEVSSKAKGIELVKEVNISEPTIVCDADRVQQVLWNLLSNAVKFTGRNGTIKLKVERNLEGEIEFEVSDTGCGISDRDLPHIFDRLWQSDTPQAIKSSGLGLGLKISKDLVEAHGGQLLAKSEGKGKGATFTARLPVRALTTDETTIKDESKLPLKSMTILVVDDNFDAVQLIKMILERAGAKVVTASDGSEALEIIRKNNIQFIVSDINMPIMDGFSFMEETRTVENEKGLGKHRPAIALTARSGPGEKERAYQAGYQLHLIKPVQPDLLIKKVLEVMRPNE